MDGRLRSLVYTDGGRFRTPWRLVAAALVFVLAQLVVALAFLGGGVPLDPTEVSGTARLAALGAFAASGVAVGLATLLAARYIDRRRIEDIGVSFGGDWWQDLGVGLALGVVLVGGAYLVGIVLGVYQPRFSPDGPSGYPVAVWFLAIVVVMVVVGTYEELLLRGYLLTNLAEGLTAVVGRRGAVFGGIGLSGIGFGALHGANPNATVVGAVTISLAGVLLGLAYVYTESLALPIGLHITWNLTHVALGVPVSGLDLGIRLVETTTSGSTLVHGGPFGPEGGILGLAAAACGCPFVVWYGYWTDRGFTADIAIPLLRE